MTMARNVPQRFCPRCAEDNHRVEQKGLPVRYVDSYVQIAAATNDEWAVPCGRYQRRFLVLEVDNRFCGPQTGETRAYFDRLAAVSPAAIAHFLYTRDLSGFNPRSVPQTRAAQHQMERTVNSVARWWASCLSQGVLLPEVQDMYDEPRAWVAPIPKADVYAKYKTVTTSHPDNEVQFWRKMCEMVWGGDSAAYKAATARPRGASGGQRRTVSFPALDACQGAFGRYVGDSARARVVGSGILKYCWFGIRVLSADTQRSLRHQQWGSSAGRGRGRGRGVGGG